MLAPMEERSFFRSNLVFKQNQWSHCPVNDIRVAPQRFCHNVFSDANALNIHSFTRIFLSLCLLYISGNFHALIKMGLKFKFINHVTPFLCVMLVNFYRLRYTLVQKTPVWFYFVTYLSISYNGVYYNSSNHKYTSCPSFCSQSCGCCSRS